MTRITFFPQAIKKTPRKSKVQHPTHHQKCPRIFCGFCAVTWTHDEALKTETGQNLSGTSIYIRCMKTRPFAVWQALREQPQAEELQAARSGARGEFGTGSPNFGPVQSAVGFGIWPFGEDFDLPLPPWWGHNMLSNRRHPEEGHFYSVLRGFVARAFRSTYNIQFPMVGQQ